MGAIGLCLRECFETKEKIWLVTGNRSPPATLRRRSVHTCTPSPPAACCSARGRSRSTAADQAGRCLENLAAVCHAAGVTLGDAVKMTIYMTDMSEFASVNEVYASFFESSPPARVAIGVAALPRGAQVEMDAVVALGG